MIRPNRAPRDRLAGHGGRRRTAASRQPAPVRRPAVASRPGRRLRGHRREPEQRGTRARCPSTCSTRAAPDLRAAGTWCGASTVRSPRSGPHLIHGSLANAGLAARLVGMRRRIPVVESLVNISHESVRVTDNPGVTRLKLEGHRLLDRITMRTVTRFQALTPAVAESWQRVVGLRPDRIEVIPRGIDLAELDAGGSRAEARESILSELGLVRGCLRRARCGPGGAPEGPPLPGRGDASDLGADPERCAPGGGSARGIEPDGRVHRSRNSVSATGCMLLGRRSDVPRLLGAADVFVFPSLFEGLGVSLLQAMGRALPVVTTDRRPMSDVVDDGIDRCARSPRGSAAIAAMR